jgi:hypothetical protein
MTFFQGDSLTATCSLLFQSKSTDQLNRKPDLFDLKPIDFADFAKRAHFSTSTLATDLEPIADDSIEGRATVGRNATESERSSDANQSQADPIECLAESIQSGGR